MQWTYEYDFVSLRVHDLIVSYGFNFQPLFLPAAITDGAGRELATVTALGAFLAASVFAEEDPSVAEKHFSGKQNSAAGNVVQ